MKRFLIMVMLLFPALAFATTVDPTAETYNWIRTATDSMSGKLQTIGFRLFYSLTLLQLIITMYGQMATGDIESSIAKLAKAVLWTLFCLWLMLNDTAYNFIANTIQYFLNHAISWTTDTSSDFSVNGIISSGLSGFTDTTKAIAKSAIPTTPAGLLTFLSGGGGGALATIIIAAVTLVIVVILIVFSTGYVALKVFMVKIESSLILAVLPLSLSFLGLSALREQGFAPFKSMLALIYRIVILGIVVGGMSKVGATLNSYASSDADPNILQMALTATFGYLLLAFLAYKSDQIASSLASGSANLGSGDAAGAAMAGAAAGAAVAAATSGVAAAGSSAIKSMADVMQGLSGSGSVSNASTRGTGKTPEAAPPKVSASMSSASPAASASFPTSSTGAPRRDAGNTGLSTSIASPAPTAPSSSADSPAAPSPANTSSNSTAGTDGGSSTKSVASQPVNEAVNAPTSADAAPAGSGEGAGIGGAPQRDLKDELGKLADALSAPKKPTHGENLKKHIGTLGQHSSNEKQATHVSVNTHQHD